MKTFEVVWESPGNIDKGTVVVMADNVVEAQDKFFAWLKAKPVYQHMWALNVKFAQVDFVEPEVIK